MDGERCSGGCGVRAQISPPPRTTGRPVPTRSSSSKRRRSRIAPWQSAPSLSRLSFAISTGSSSRLTSRLDNIEGHDRGGSTGFYRSKGAEVLRTVCLVRMTIVKRSLLSRGSLQDTLAFKSLLSGASSFAIVAGKNLVAHEPVLAHLREHLGRDFGKSARKVPEKFLTRFWRWSIGSKSADFRRFGGWPV